MTSFLHTCYRIGDVDRSVAFYEKLGFAEVRRMPIGEEAVNVFMALPGEDPRLEPQPASARPLPVFSGQWLSIMPACRAMRYQVVPIVIRAPQGWSFSALKASAGRRSGQSLSRDLRLPRIHQ